MPTYRVDTDQGAFHVELDREPASPEEMRSLVLDAIQQGRAPVEPQGLGTAIKEGYKTYVADPLTKVVQRGGEALDWADRGFGLFKAPEGPAASDATARAVVPQTPEELLMMLGTGGAGAAAARAGLTGGAAALARIAGGTAGGATGAALQGDSPLQGAGVGLTAGAVGEGATALGGKLVRSTEPGRSYISRKDAESFANAANEAAPTLKLGTTPGAIWQGAEGGALANINAGKEAAIQEIEGIIGNRPIMMSRFTERPVSLREANAELSYIGDMMRGRKPLDPRMKETDLARAYAEQAEGIRRGIAAAEASHDAAQQAATREQTPQIVREGGPLALPPRSHPGEIGPSRTFVAGEFPGGEIAETRGLAPGGERRQPQDVRDLLDLVEASRTPLSQRGSNVRSLEAAQDLNVRRPLDLGQPGQRRMATQGGPYAESLPPAGPYVAMPDTSRGNAVIPRVETTVAERPFVPDVERVGSARPPESAAAPLAPRALDIWDRAQAEYRAGRGIVNELLARPGLFDPRGRFTLTDLQTYLRDPAHRASLAEKLGGSLQTREHLDAYLSLVNAIQRTAGAGPAGRDALAGEAPGFFSGRGSRGSLSLLTEPVRHVFPNASTSYIGRPPLTPPDSLRALIDMALERLGGGLADSARGR